MNEFAGKNVTVLGLGRSGQAVARLLQELGARVFASDAGQSVVLKETAAELGRLGVSCEIGRHSEAVYAGKDLIVLSPGIPDSIPILQAAKANGVPILSEVEIAYRLTKATVIGITGTNGKSTTTSLLGALLQTAGREVAVAGNIGVAVSEVARGLSDKGLLVLELSSFQLENIARFRPHIALLLNITPDHMDRYSALENYIAAKARIFENQTETDFAILNAEDPVVMRLGQDIAAQIRTFSLHQSPQHDGPFVDAQNFMLREKGQDRQICPIDEMRIKGPHNVQNALAALSAAHLLGVSSEAMAETLRNFGGLEHRIEFVRELDGVRYYNDSKATTVESTIAAVNSFPNIVLIAGGYDKGADFAPLREPVAQHVKHALLIGKTREKLRQIFDDCTFMDSLEAAVRHARQLAQPGDVVLLSPACASYDMFKNFEDRGQQFKDLVRNL